MVLLLIVFLSVTDAFITLELVRAGGEELNPVMALFLRFGAIPFLLVKYALTGIGSLFMILHKEYHFFDTWIQGKHLMTLILLMYLALLAWELHLLGRL